MSQERNIQGPDGGMERQREGLIRADAKGADAPFTTWPRFLLARPPRAEREARWMGRMAAAAVPGGTARAL